MQRTKLKKIMLLVGLVILTIWCNANVFQIKDGHSHINVKEAHVQGPPKGSTIQAYIDGHVLTVAFTENLGSVSIEITTVTGTTIQTFWMSTPNGLQTELYLTGDYVITFTLPNGDEYYGEFTVTD